MITAGTATVYSIHQSALNGCTPLVRNRVSFGPACAMIDDSQHVFVTLLWGHKWSMPIISNGYLDLHQSNTLECTYWLFLPHLAS